MNITQVGIDLAKMVFQVHGVDARGKVLIRLRPDDQILLRERAAARGMPPATYVSVLTRAHLRSLAPLPAEELLALKRTIGELGSIGRNLNQIARAANQGQLVTSPGRDDLEAMLRVCGTLRDGLKRVLLANLKSLGARLCLAVP
jgi:hypothetical protein